MLDNKKTICDSPCLIATPSTEIATMCLGDLTKNYALEDWAKIFDIFKDEKPPWVLDETYDFMNTHSFFFFLINNANCPSIIKSMMFRFILRIYRTSLILGFSTQLDQFLHSASGLLRKMKL